MSTRALIPGPWHIAHAPDYASCCDVASDTTGEDVCSVWSEPESTTARLIAAAPELLAALRGLRAAQDALFDTGHCIEACHQYDRAEAVAAALLARLDGTAAGEPESEALSGSV